MKSKSLIASLAAAAAVLAVPVASFAQQTGALTREQVKAELATLEKAGYNPSADRANYPNGLRAAEARVHPQQNVAAVDTTGYGAEAAPQHEAGNTAARAGGSARFARISDGAPIYKGR